MRRIKRQTHQWIKFQKPPYTYLKTGVVFVFVLIVGLSYINPTTHAQSDESATSTTSATSTAPRTSSSMREKLENKLEELESEIAEQEKQIGEIRDKKRTLKNEIAGYDAQINKLNLQIEAVNLSLEKLNQDIYETQQQINRTQNKIEEHKEALEKGIQTIYETDNQSLIAILLSNDKISDFFNNINNLLLVQNNVQNSLEQIVELRQNLIAQKRELGLEKRDVKNLKGIRQNQKQQVRVAQQNKNEVLEVTKSQESKYQELLTQTKKTAAEVRSQIFKLVGGGELNFEKAYKFAKLAEGSTGVRAALTLAILSRESLLGKNVGSCNYKEAMHPDRDIPVFKAITSNLNIDPNSTVAQVSCPITQHGSYGGAMGPAQFIPSTWAIYGGYEKTDNGWEYDEGEDLIRDVAGSDGPSNPWNNAHAFVATSLYIKDLLESPGCQNYAEEYNHILPEQTLQERCAAAKYYAGGRWWTYRFWYGDAVLTKAEELQDDINVLEQG